MKLYVLGDVVNTVLFKGDRIGSGLNSPAAPPLQAKIVGSGAQSELILGGETKLSKYTVAFES